MSLLAHHRERSSPNAIGNAARAASANAIGDLSWDSWELPGGLYVGKLPVLIFVTAVVLLAWLQLMLTHTKLGRAIRATAEDPDTAGLVGIDAGRVNAAAAAITLGATGRRGALSPGGGVAGLRFPGVAPSSAAVGTGKPTGTEAGGSAGP